MLLLYNYYILLLVAIGKLESTAVTLFLRCLAPQHFSTSEITFTKAQNSSKLLSSTICRVDQMHFSARFCLFCFKKNLVNNFLDLLLFIFKCHLNLEQFLIFKFQSFHLIIVQIQKSIQFL